MGFAPSAPDGTHWASPVVVDLVVDELSLLVQVLLLCVCGVFGAAESFVPFCVVVVSAASVSGQFCVGVAALPLDSAFQNFSRTSSIATGTVTGRCVHPRYTPS